MPTLFFFANEPADDALVQQHAGLSMVMRSALVT
jgi:hypothetical protein